MAGDHGDKSWGCAIIAALCLLVWVGVLIWGIAAYLHAFHM